MDLLSIIIIGLGLAMDCFAVSISKGICLKKYKFKKALRMAFLFGFFQGLMPMIGYYCGTAFINIIKQYDHWIAFILLSAIGAKMLVEGLKPLDNPVEKEHKPFKWKTLFLLAIATSIDALATGPIFVPYPDKLWVAVGYIAFISFSLSLVGVYIGMRFKHKIKLNVELIGAIMLIAIGIKILIEHINSI